MKKNVASQIVGAQMISSTDGTDFTGAVVCYVTGDGGAQATGSVGSGACTHEGNGFHTYTPAQAETNYDHVAFTFRGTGAITATRQEYPEFPQTGDAFARLGAPAGASVSADVAAMKVDTAAILVDTGTTLDGKINTIDDFLDTEVAAILAAVDTEVAAIKAVTDLLPNAGALTSLATQASVNTIDDFLDTEVAAIKAVTDALGTSAAARLQVAVLSELPGTVDNTGFAPTTTEFEADDITESTDDHFNGRVIIFTSGILQYQATSISNYTLTAGRGHFTVVALTEAPGNNDTFIIV